MARPVDLRPVLASAAQGAAVTFDQCAAALDVSGVCAEQMRRSIEPFYTTRPNGTGLGLPIARQIAVAHGGDIVIESEPGQGTVVRVHLPHPVQDANAFVR